MVPHYLAWAHFFSIKRRYIKRQVTDVRCWTQWYSALNYFSKIIKFQNKQLTYFVEMDVAAWFMGKTLNCAWTPPFSPSSDTTEQNLGLWICLLVFFPLSGGMRLEPSWITSPATWLFESLWKVKVTLMTSWEIDSTGTSGRTRPLGRRKDKTYKT